MKVFISWSGEPSRRAAQRLRQHLPRMIQSLKPFMSQGDIGSGTRWASEVAQQLDQTDFGIVCLTLDNRTAPWLMFEAGALAKSVERGRVCCLLLRGLEPLDVTGPLDQFQNRPFVKDEFWHLLRDLKSHLKESLDTGTLQASFDKFWPDLEKEVEADLADPKLDAPVAHKRGQLDLLEELLLRVRNIESLVDRPVGTMPEVVDFEAVPDHSIVRRSRRRDIPLSAKFRALSPTQIALLSEFLHPEGGASRAIKLEYLEKKYSEDDIGFVIASDFLVEHGYDNDVKLNPNILEALTSHLRKRGLPLGPSD